MTIEEKIAEHYYRGRNFLRNSPLSNMSREEILNYIIKEWRWDCKEREERAFPFSVFYFDPRIVDLILENPAESLTSASNYIRRLAEVNLQLRASRSSSNSMNRYPLK